MMGNAVGTYTGGDAPRLGDVFWGRVNSCHADRSVSFRVIGYAVIALIIVGADIIVYVGGCGGCGGGTRLLMNDDGRWPFVVPW